jgi:hypothetical protein
MSNSPIVNRFTGSLIVTISADEGTHIAAVPVRERALPGTTVLACFEPPLERTEIKINIRTRLA